MLFDDLQALVHAFNVVDDALSHAPCVGRECSRRCRDFGGSAIGDSTLVLGRAPATRIVFRRDALGQCSKSNICRRCRLHRC